MANVSQAQATQLLTKHYSNILSSLNRRLEAARAAQNWRLIEMLEQERQQVAHDADQLQAAMLPVVAKIGAWLRSLGRAIATSSELQVWQQIDALGDRWWCAYDPQTGQSVVVDSDTELRLWIEQNYSGR